MNTKSDFFGAAEKQKNSIVFYLGTVGVVHSVEAGG